VGIGVEVMHFLELERMEGLVQVASWVACCRGEVRPAVYVRSFTGLLVYGGIRGWCGWEGEGRCRYDSKLQSASPSC